MKRSFLSVFLILLSVGLSIQPGAFAGDVTDGAGSAGTVVKAERGFNNTLLGWVEIPKKIVEKTKESNIIKGFFIGVFQGTCKAVARTASGAADLATFPVGRYDRPSILPDMPGIE